MLLFVYSARTQYGQHCIFFIQCLYNAYVTLHITAHTQLHKKYTVFVRF
jgi:hypothetical protein